MKTKKFKRVLTLVLALAMMLSLSMVAFASGSVTLYINGVSQGSFDIGNDTTVYDIVSQLTTTWSNEYNADTTYSPLYNSNSPLNGKYNHKVIYMRTLNGVGTTGYEPLDGALDEDDYYDPDQTVDTVLMEADARLTQYGGLDYWLGNGYGIAADWQHMVYIGEDWVFTVNGITIQVPMDPNDPNYEVYGHYFQYSMRECLLANGDTIELDYVPSFLVFDPAA